MAKKKKGIGLLLIFAGLFLGLGVGFLIYQVWASGLIGLGVGFLAAFINAILKKK